jgi:hypothetical protein
MELMLVTPLRERQIIVGRVLGLWNQFFPAAVILSASWVYLSVNARTFFGGGYRLMTWATVQQVGLPVFFMIAYATLPLIGLYFSFGRLPLIAAWIFTSLIGLLAPWLAFVVIAFQNRGNELDVPLVFGSVIGMQVVCALLAGTLLYYHLARRHFVGLHAPA